MTPGQNGKHMPGVPTDVLLVGGGAGVEGEQSCPIPGGAAPLHPEQNASLPPPAHQRRVTHQGIPGSTVSEAEVGLDALLFRQAGIAESMENSRKRQLHAEAEGCKREHPPAVALPIHRARGPCGWEEMVGPGQSHWQVSGVLWSHPAPATVAFPLAPVTQQNETTEEPSVGS